jgi:MFS family permease
MALTNLAVFGGAFFTPILVGKITHTIGWPWSFYFVAIFCGACLPAVFFFVPETAYRRSAYLNTDMASSDDVRTHRDAVDLQVLHNSSSPPINGHDSDEKHLTPQGSAPGPSADNVSNDKTPYRQSLRIFNGRKTSESFWKLLIRPFPLLLHPAIFWACLIQGTLIGWTVFIGIILAAVFISPPIFWTEVETGYAYAGAFVGALLGFLLSGLLADYSAKFMTRRNNGIYEPEFRLLLVIPQLVFGCMGLFGFGVTSSRVIDFGWFWPVFFFGCEVMGMVIGAVASALYIVDAHRKFIPVLHL